MYDRMIREHGYSIRRLAEKLGKDKGYLENRLRLADAPPEVRELVSLRKDTLSHAYELMKVADPQEAQEAGRAGGPERAVPRQAARADRGSAGPRRRRAARTSCRRRRRPSRAARPRLTQTADWTAEPRRRPSRSATTAWSPPSSSSTRRSRISSTSSATRDVLAAIGSVGPGQPRQVPDDRQAPAGERDRRRPERRPGPLARRPPPTGDSEAGATGAGFFDVGSGHPGGAMVSGAGRRGARPSVGGAAAAAAWRLAAGPSPASTLPSAAAFRRPWWPW